MPIYNGIEFIDESISTILYQNYMLAIIRTLAICFTYSFALS